MIHDRRENERLEYLGKAAYYALVLKLQGYAPDEAAALVVERYPRARQQLQQFLDGHHWELFIRPRQGKAVPDESTEGEPRQVEGVREAVAPPGRR